MIDRNQLHIRDVISYGFENSSLVLHGEIIHVGLGLASRSAVWIRAIDGYAKGEILYVMIAQIMEVVHRVGR